MAVRPSWLASVATGFFNSHQSDCGSDPGQLVQP